MPGDHKSLKLWDVTSGHCLRTFKGHVDKVLSVCLSGDGRFAFSGSADRTVRLWEVATGRCLHTFDGHDDRVLSVCLSRDGRFLLSGSADRTLRLWELDWDLQIREPTDWDEGARAYLEQFLTAHCPGRLVNWLKKLVGVPSWSKKDFKRLLSTLGCAGYGWLRPNGVHHELEQMAVEWRNSQSLAERIMEGITDGFRNPVIWLLVIGPIAVMVLLVLFALTRH